MSSWTRAAVGVRDAIPDTLRLARAAPGAWPAGPRVALLVVVSVVFGLPLWWPFRTVATEPSAGATLGALAPAVGCALLWPRAAARIGAAPVAGTVLLAGAGVIALGVSVPAAGGAVLCLALAGTLAGAPGRMWLLDRPGCPVPRSA